MIIRNPQRIHELFGEWRTYVNFVTVEIDTRDATRHYRVDLTGRVPGLDFSRLNPNQERRDGIFYWGHIGATGDPGEAVVTIDANWRHGGEIANYTQPLAAVDSGGKLHTVTFADFQLCDPLVVQGWLPLMLEDLDREVGATLSRDKEGRFPPR